MTDQEILDLVKGLQESTERQIEVLRKEANNLVDAYQKRYDIILESSNRKRCDRCKGTGALEKLDGAIMRRFMMKDWIGCDKCGGTHDEKGLGFLPKE